MALRVVAATRRNGVANSLQKHGRHDEKVQSVLTDRATATRNDETAFTASHIYDVVTIAVSSTMLFILLVLRFVFFGASESML